MSRDKAVPAEAKAQQPEPPGVTEDGPERPLTRASGRSILIGLVAVAVFLYAIRVILLPFVLAGAAAYAISPGVDKLGELLGNRRWLASLVVLIVVLALAAGLVIFVGPVAIQSIIDVAGNLEALVAHLLGSFIGTGPVTLFGQAMTAEQMAHRFVEMAAEWFTQNGRALLITGWAFSSMFGGVLTLVLFAYFLFSGPKIGAGMFRLIPPAQRHVCEEIWKLTGPVLRRYFIGIVLVVVYASTAAYIGLGIALNLPHALLLAVLSGILEIVPVIGPAAAALIVGLAAVEQAKGDWGIIAFVIYAVLLRLSIDDLVGPLLLGKAGRIHPTVVIFCFLAGGILFGLSGLIMAVPVALMIKVALGVLYEDPETEARLKEMR